MRYILILVIFISGTLSALASYPSEGYEDQEVLDRYGEISHQVSPAEYQEAARDAFGHLSPQDREEFEDGVGCIAVVITQNSEAAGAMSISGPSSRLFGANTGRLAAEVVRSAAAVSHRISGS